MNKKKGLIMGLANDHSLAFGIAQILHANGAELAFTYHPLVEKRVRAIGEKFGSSIFIPCDVSVPGQIEDAFDTLQEWYGEIDFVVHAIAFSDKDELKGGYCDTSRENFLNTLDVSCYSFTKVCQRAAQLMPHGGSILTLTYYGAEKVMPNYNVMGIAKAALEASIMYLAVDLGGSNIRINGISAGPVKTLAASGIGDFRYILKWNQYNAPLKRNTTLHDVGGAALFLLSELSSGVTGEIIHADSGYHVVGMKAIDAPDISVVMNTN